MTSEYAKLGSVGSEVKSVFGDEGIHWSCLGSQGEDRLLWCARYLTVGNPKFEHRRPVCLEIGTHHGVSSTILALQGIDVITLDIEKYPVQRRIWAHFGVEGRISPLITTGDADTARLAENAQFDLAFIDGCHALESVKANFAAVQKCGRVIFHDYEMKCHKDRTVAFVNALDYGRTTKLSPFAVWESPEVAGCPWGRLA